MLKIRIIPCLLFKDRTIVKSMQFNELRMVGDPTTCARVFNQRKVDELIFLDIMASRKDKEPNFRVMKDIAKECFMPLTMGGGIKRMSHIDRLFEIGADKIAINTRIIEDPEFITDVSKKYGSQAIVASIDAKKVDGKYRVFIKGGKVKTAYEPAQLAKKVEKLGAGEILINSIDKDGTTRGYDIGLIRSVTESTNIPVIACGGAGCLQDFVDAIKEGKADAVSGASIFFFVGESIITAKQYMHEKGLNVRLL